MAAISGIAFTGLCFLVDLIASTVEGDNGDEDGVGGVEKGRGWGDRGSAISRGEWWKVGQEGERKQDGKTHRVRHVGWARARANWYCRAAAQ